MGRTVDEVLGDLVEADVAGLGCAAQDGEPLRAHTYRQERTVDDPADDLIGGRSPVAAIQHDH